MNLRVIISACGLCLPQCKQDLTEWPRYEFPVNGETTDLELVPQTVVQYGRFGDRFTHAGIVLFAAVTSMSMQRPRIGQELGRRVSRPQITHLLSG